MYLLQPWQIEKMRVTQQQEKQVTRKRISSEQVENGGTEKKKMIEEEPGATQRDSKDGANMSIQLEVQLSHVHTEV